MKTSLAHLPADKQAELKAVGDVITRNFPEVQMIILYGSFARGNWVEDTYKKDGTTYTYQSDYDILVLLEDNAQADDVNLTFNINETVKQLGLNTPASLIFHGLDYVNKQISNGSWFFCEIRNEGILLYNSTKYNIANERKLNPAEIKVNALRDFKNYFESANRFFETFQFNLHKSYFNEAAFLLHQATERYYNTILLVFTGYKPKSHDIELLGKKACGLDSRFKAVFPMNTEEQKHRFTLLKKAYIDARYDMQYKITREELEYLSVCVKVLRELTEKICNERINSIEE